MSNDRVSVEIKYNPYLVKTEVFVNGKEIDSNSSLKYVCDRRLQEWIEPKGRWKGIFKELRNALGESEINIDFIGTSSDFQDLHYAANHYGECFSYYALNHKNKEEAKHNSPYEKMKELKSLYKELQEGPIEEFKTADIQANFENAVNSDFKIVVVAPISSGKSTLINSIISRDLLPAMKQATTAVITEIKDNDNLDSFFVSAEDKSGNIIVEKEPATKELISRLNSLKEPYEEANEEELNDDDQKKALLRKIMIEGPIPNLSSEQLSTVFVDTPGGNNANNTEHEEMMDKAINDEKKSLILYIFIGEQIGTHDSNAILKKIANAMKNSANGKQSRDRFLFVANCMDEYDLENDSYDNTIKDILDELAKFGIVEPNLFLVSAKTARLIRMIRNNERLTESEEIDIDSLLKKLNRNNRMLQRYASISVQERERQLQESQKYTEMEPDYKKRSDELKYQIAELNSGIPALEYAISEYLEKYALAMKIKDAHDAFMKKVIERNMIDNCEKEWATSKEEFESAKKELEAKREKFKQNNKLKEFREKVEGIKLDKEPVRREKAKVVDKMNALVKSAPDKVKKTEATYLLQRFKRELEEIGNNAQIELNNALKNGVIKACQDIIDEYTVYIEQMRKDGYFNIGNFDMKKTAVFSKFEVKKPEDMIRQGNYTTTEREVVGSHKEKKRGLIGFIHRVFGSERGYITEYDYGNVEYISLKDLFTDQITDIQHSLDKHINLLTKDTEEAVTQYKRDTMTKLKDLDQMVNSLMEEIEKLLKNQDDLSRKVKDNEKKTEWIKGFVKRVENLLMV